MRLIVRPQQTRLVRADEDCRNLLMVRPMTKRLTFQLLTTDTVRTLPLCHCD